MSQEEYFIDIVYKIYIIAIKYILFIKVFKFIKSLSVLNGTIFSGYNINISYVLTVDYLNE